MNPLHQTFAQFPQGCQFGQICSTQSNICCFTSNIRGITHCNRNICRCECWCIVDTITNHNDPFSLCFQFFDITVLVLRQNLCMILRNAQHFCSSAGCLFAVTRQHDKVADTSFLQHGNCLLCLCSWRVCNAEHPCQF